MPSVFITLPEQYSHVNVRPLPVIKIGPLDQLLICIAIKKQGSMPRIFLWPTALLFYFILFHLSLFYQTFMLFRLFIIINSNQQNVSNIRFQWCNVLFLFDLIQCRMGWMIPLNLTCHPRWALPDPHLRRLSRCGNRFRRTCLQLRQELCRYACGSSLQRRPHVQSGSRTALRQWTAPAGSRAADHRGTRTVIPRSLR